MILTIVIAVVSSIMCAWGGFSIGKNYMKNLVIKQNDDNIQYLRKIIYDLILFGHQKGFPFPEEKREEKGLTLSAMEILILSLEDALDNENYERAAQLRDQITQIENNKKL